MLKDGVGISGLAAYVPPFRVSLEDWCDWTGNCWDKTRSVIGQSFRMLGPNQSVYTMAATAVLRLIENYDIDPRQVGFLGLGTESSTDNSAGAVIVKGMIDELLIQSGRQPISRHCEVPEVKHACLGGIYAMKNALRFLALDGAGRLAIVVSADIAEYARGSSGEPTQGAGAVAMLLERQPKLLSVDLLNSASASAYREVDFRKPRSQLLKQSNNGTIHDQPIFNGKYSTTCYLDETLHALRRMLEKLDCDPGEYYRSLEAVFMHRPYHRMPVTSWGLSYLFGLAGDGLAGENELEHYCQQTGLDFAPLLSEMRSTPDVLSFTHNGNPNADAYPMSMQLLRSLRGSDSFQRTVSSKIELGSELMKEMGNLYTAALPAWLAAGLEEALVENRELAGKNVLAVGYGSGDAAEAIPMKVVDGWQDAAARIGFGAALNPALNLSRAQYESLHETGDATGLEYEPSREFIVDRIGDGARPHLDDEGIEYYRFVQ